MQLVQPREYLAANDLEEMSDQLRRVLPIEQFEDIEEDITSSSVIDSGKYLRVRKDKLALDKLNPLLTHTFQCLIESTISDSWDKTNPIMLNMFGLFASKMRVLGKKNPDYDAFVTTYTDLAYRAEEGNTVKLEKDLTKFDYADVFKALDVLTKKQFGRGATQWRGLTLYPLQNIQSDVKQYALYPLLDSFCDGLAKYIKKNKVSVYITSDFQFAIDHDLRNILELQSLSGLLNQNFYQLGSTKIYSLPLFEHSEVDQQAAS